MFDEYLQKRAAKEGTTFQPFEIATDYSLYVDGKLRDDGLRDFLRMRELELPEGTPDNPPKTETMCGLGNRKNEMVHEVIESVGGEEYAGTIALARQIRNEGIKIAVVTSNRNCDEVRKVAKIADLFQFKVDGNAIAQ